MGPIFRCYLITQVHWETQKLYRLQTCSSWDWNFFILKGNLLTNLKFPTSEEEKQTFLIQNSLKNRKISLKSLRRLQWTFLQFLLLHQSQDCVVKSRLFEMWERCDDKRFRCIQWFFTIFCPPQFILSEPILSCLIKTFHFMFFLNFATCFWWFWLVLRSKFYQVEAGFKNLSW